MGSLLVPAVFCEMKEKSRFNELSRWVYITVGASKLAFTLLAFFAFQDRTADAVSLNIEALSTRTVVSVSIVVDKLLTTPLILYTPRLQLEAFLPKPKNNPALAPILTYFYRFLVSSFLLAISIALAIAIPNFAIFSSLMGSLFGMSFIYILPVVFWLRLAKEKSKFDIVLGLWIIFTASVSLVGGLYQNVIVIRNELHE